MTGYEIKVVRVDGEPVELETAEGVFGETIYQYTFESVAADHSI